MPPIAANQIEQKPLSQDAQVGDPALNPGEGIFYAKDVSGSIEAFFKNGAGQVIQLTESGQLKGLASLVGFEKLFQNLSGVAIPANKPVSIIADGSIVASDSDAPGASKVVGFTKASINHNASGLVTLFGRNLAGVLTGLGFAPGEFVFMDETAGGMTNSIAGFTGDDDTITKLGIAAMGEGLVGGAATDLIMLRDPVVTP